MNNSNNYYLHINSNTLPHIFVSGCIRPTVLIERRETDDQSLFPEFVLLSLKKWSKSCDCSVLLFLTDEEVSQLKSISNENFLFDSFFPVSRIKKIYFLNEEKSKTVLWNIRNGAGFIPDNFIKVETRLNSETSLDSEQPKESYSNNRIEDTKKTYLRYNRLLGGLAFLRVALDDVFDKSINYPVNYIASISFFNTLIKREFSKSTVKKDFKLHSFFTTEANILKYLNKEITNDLIESVASTEKVILTKKFGTSYNLDSIPKHTLTFNLCLLYTYGKSGSKSLEDFIGKYFSTTENEKNEELALTFGIYFGYQSIRNFYKLNDRKINVKFELESRLDFYIIESVFSFVSKNNFIAGELEFIDSEFTLLPKLKLNSDYQQYTILGTLISIKKKDYSEFFMELINGIADEFSTFFPKEIVTINTNSLVKHFYQKFKHPYSNTIENIKNDIKEGMELKKTEDKLDTPKKISLSDLANATKTEKAEPKSVIFEQQNQKYQEEKVQRRNPEKNDLYDGLEVTIRITEKAVKRAKTIDELTSLAKSANINIPPQFRKKNDLVEFLLSKCSEY